MREIGITVKPTLSCNMRCKHCFNGEKMRQSGVIPVERVILLLQKASIEYDIIKITFHGGEPTLAGIDFYKAIFDFQRRKNKEDGTVFRNFFTTNGLLLNEKFIDLLIENETLINVSFDGPYNSVLRQYTDKVFENIKLIQKKKGRLRCYCTLSKDSYSNLGEIYNWFKMQNIDFKTLPIERVGFAKESNDLIMKPEDLVNVFVNVYRNWIHDKECGIRYYTFEEFSSLRHEMQFKKYWFNRKIALNPDGNIYPFGRPNDVNFCLGTPESIVKTEDCFTSKCYLKLRERLQGFYNTKCQSCISKGVCNGVAICMTYMYEDEEEILDYSCSQASLIFQGILAVNDEIATDFRNGNIDSYTEIIQKKFADYQKNYLMV